MEITSNQLERARETLSTLLEEIGLTDYVFDIEPGERRWDVNIECAIDQSWECFHLTADPEYITRGKDDAILHQFLMDEWSEALKDCRKK